MTFKDLKQKLAKLQKCLNSFRKPIPVDPLRKRVGSYNSYLIKMCKFFEWLYYPDLAASEREKNLL